MNLIFLFLVIFFGVMITNTVWAQKRPLTNPFFVFHNGVRDSLYDTWQEQARLVREMGFDGMEIEGLDGLEEAIRVLHINQRKLYAIYLKIDLDNAAQPFDERLENCFQLIAGSEAMPWFYVVSKKAPPSSPTLDSVAVPLIRSVAALAARHKVRVMLYPHLYFWLQSPDDAIRLCEKVNMPNIGFTFNLCHYLGHGVLYGQHESFEKTVYRSMPYLFAVSINGADSSVTDKTQLWRTLIQPLGDGTYDTYRYIKTFADAGFTGPVGLQCFNIREEKKSHLKRSVNTWKGYKRVYQPSWKKNKKGKGLSNEIRMKQNFNTHEK